MTREELNGNKKRILFIDDEVSFTTFMPAVLPAWEVCVETNALRAIETVRKFKPDLIFLDVIMPDMDGGTVAARLRQDPLLSTIPVVFLTAILSEKDARSRLDIGGYPFLAKPVSRDQIVECINRHLGS